MKKYIIVKIDSNTHKHTYLYGDDNTNFEWVENHEIANHYCNYDLALLDWAYACKWYNPNGDRIVIPIYDPTQLPWKDEP